MELDHMIPVVGLSICLLMIFLVKCVNHNTSDYFLSKKHEGSSG